MPEKRLKPSQKQKARDEESVTAGITYEVIRRLGDEELRRPTRALAWSGLAAGLSMGFSLLAEAVLQAHLPPTEWAHLVSKLGYSVGFLIVILGSQQLFTENTLTAVVPVLSRYSHAGARDVARLWGIVLAANLVGTALFACVLAWLPILSAPTSAAVSAIAVAVIAPDGIAMFARAIFAGWLIALMVWMLPGAQHARVPVIVLMTWLVGAAELPHVIAGSSEIVYLAARGEIAWLDYFPRFLVPTLLGNTFGGLMMVTGLNHAQVVAGNGDGEA